MGILGENDYENLRMMSHSTEMFLPCDLGTLEGVDDENDKA